MQLAAYRNEGGLAALFKGNARRQAEQDEQAIANTGVPYTIVRPGALRDEPGGQLGFQFAQVYLTTIWYGFLCNKLVEVFSFSAHFFYKYEISVRYGTKSAGSQVTAYFLF